MPCLRQNSGMEKASVSASGSWSARTVCSANRGPGGRQLWRGAGFCILVACLRVRIVPHFRVEEPTSEARLKFVGAYERKATIGMDVDQHQCCTRKSKRIAEQSKRRFDAVRDINNSSAY